MFTNKLVKLLSAFAFAGILSSQTVMAQDDGIEVIQDDADLPVTLTEGNFE